MNIFIPKIKIKVCNALLQLINAQSSSQNSGSYQRCRKADEAAGAEKQKKGSAKLQSLQTTPPVALAFLGRFVSSHNCCILIKYFLPVFESTPRNIFERSAGHLQPKLSRSKVSDVADIRERYLRRASPAPVLPPYHQGNAGSWPLDLIL